MTAIFDIISQLRRLDGSFAKGEQLVADFVLGNPEQVTHMRLSEIADEAGVSVATVNRFCQTLGCEGFKDFRIIFAQSVAVSLQYLGGPSDTTSPNDQLVTKVFGALIDSLSLARGQLRDEEIEAAVSVLSAARQIVFFGVGGGSANVAQEGANRFFRLGIPSSAYSDGFFQRMLASTLKEGDVLFAISASGSPGELLDSVVAAHQYGARSVCLTKTGSPLARLCHCTICIDIPEDQDIFKPTASRLVFMAIIDVLATAVAQTRPDIVKENLRRIRTTLLPLMPDEGPKPIGD
jgi:DNA-binding MurR/RpiR family transcriptional regulator